MRIKSWADFKTAVSELPVQYKDAEDHYWIQAYNGSNKITHVMHKEATPHADQTDFETNVKPTANAVLEHRDASNKVVISPGMRESQSGQDGLTVVTHDWGDRTTWYQYAEKITDQILTDSGDGLTFNSTKNYWINIDSSRLTFDYKTVMKKDGTFGQKTDWRPVVKVNDVVQTSGYTVNYVTGDITFNSSQSGNTVKVTFHHNDGVTGRSRWNLMCNSSYVSLVIEHLEIQFSRASTFPKAMKVQIWAGGTLATYEAVGWSDGAYDAGYGQEWSEYKGVKDLINICNRGTGTIPAGGELTDDVLVFPFNYLYAQKITNQYDVCLTITMVDDEPMGSAELATATFYMGRQA